MNTKLLVVFLGPLLLSGCGSMMFQPMDASTDQKRMECVARLLNLPVPATLPSIQIVTPEEIDGKLGQYLPGLIQVINPRFIPHEMAHHVMHGHNLAWEENRAQFVQAKFGTWCVTR